MSTIDLHMHSNYSLDGQYSPKELINLCKMAGLKFISITDHNSVDSLEEAHFYAKLSNIKLISGIEIDCSYNNINMHLLGYNIHYTASVFQKLKDSFFKQELNASRERLKKVNALGFNLSINDFIKSYGDSIFSPEDIADYLLNSSDAYNHELLLPYLNGGPRSDNPNVNFYWDFFAKGKPCYIPIQIPSLKETIQLVNDTGGIPIVAHPGATFKDNLHYLNELASFGIQGIEVFSSYHSYEECQYFYRLAKKNNLIVTAGSDFHGKHKPKVKLSKTNCFLNDQLLLSSINSLIARI